MNRLPSELRSTPPSPRTDSVTSRPATDNGQTIQRELVTRHAINSFDRFSCSLIYVDFETGVGLTTPVQGYDPVVMMQLSRDNGANWGPESWKKLGKTGKTRTRIVRRRNGSGRSYVMRLKMTDPVKWAITAGALGMRARRQT